MLHNKSRLSKTMLSVAVALSCSAVTATHDAIANGLESGVGGTVKPVVFEEMVSKLFKRDPLFANEVMHAAIGMAGESTELIAADDLEDTANVLEELGDYRFYLQALFERFGWSVDSFAGAELRLDQWDKSNVALPYSTMLALATGDVMDLAKKSWVYGKDMDVVKLFDAVHICLHYYSEVSELYGFDDVTIKAANISKLVSGPNARFKEGYYTDAAAIARADKVVESATAA